jgi:hypothetical protein
MATLASVDLEVTWATPYEGQKLACAIVEPRNHKDLKAVLNSVARIYANTEASLYIFHGTRNADFVKAIVKNWNNAHLINLGVPNLERSGSYSNLLTSKSFYKWFKASHVLVFQTDSLIRREIDAQFFEYDYVGAPVGPWLGLLTRDTLNGGFSLRNVKTFMSYLDLYGEPQNPGNEDMWWCKEFSGPRGIKANIKLPSKELASHFSVESIFYEDPVGMHQVYRFLNQQQLNRLLQVFNGSILSTPHSTNNDHINTNNINDTCIYIHGSQNYSWLDVKNTFEPFLQPYIDSGAEIRSTPTKTFCSNVIIMGIDALLLLNTIISINTSCSNFSYFNTEQITRNEIIKTMQKCITKQESLHYIDYSQKNIEIWKNMSTMKSYLYKPVTSTSNDYKLYDMLVSTSKEYDFAFVGSLSKRRKDIIEQIEKSYKVNIVTGWGEKRDKEICKCKYLLNIHYDDDYLIFESPRCNRWIENGMKVVSEQSFDNPEKNNVIFFPYLLLGCYQGPFNTNNKCTAVVSADIGSFDNVVNNFSVLHSAGACFKFTKNDYLIESNRLKSKYYKFLSHTIFPNYYKYIMWVDGAIKFKKDLCYFLSSQMSAEDDIICFLHPFRKTVQQEADYVCQEIKKNNCYLTKRYDCDSIQKFMKKITNDGFDVNSQLCANGIFLKKNEDKINNAFNEIYALIKEYTLLCQIIMPYVFWKHKIKCKITSINIYDSEYHTIDHSRRR